MRSGGVLMRGAAKVEDEKKEDKVKHKKKERKFLILGTERARQLLNDDANIRVRVGCERIPLTI